MRTLELLVPAAAALLIVTAASACNDEPITGGATVASVARTTDAGPQTLVNGSPGDLAEIQQIVTTFDQSWAVDAVAYAGQYAGAEWTGPNGAILTDPAAITGTYTFLFNVVFAGTTRQSTIRSLTFLSGTIAVLDIDAKVTGIPASFPNPVYAPGMVRARERNILLKRGGEWRITKHVQVVVAAGVPCPGCP